MQSELEDTWRQNKQQLYGVIGRAGHSPVAGNTGL